MNQSDNILNMLIFLIFLAILKWYNKAVFPSSSVVKSGYKSDCQCRRHEFSPWAGTIPWRRKWQPVPVFLPGKFYGQRSLVGYSPRGSQRVGYNWMTKYTGMIEQNDLLMWHAVQFLRIKVHDTCNIFSSILEKNREWLCYCGNILTMSETKPRWSIHKIFFGLSL